MRFPNSREASRSSVVAKNKALGLTLHTDFGSQYTSEFFGERFKKYEMMPLFSRKGCPYANERIESFHATLKKKK
ncbi:DDE-type integrase/transposase/recombinase [Viridibacillus sp. YIM B01967]|uniref:DDE-type integrase/transposase/recombinase n=1 Tax=Viridibacillus soli TaxID=2798301 RepID=A0ABS1H3K5_9BACL|nr:DDE-type integrase/transposase/recombinase [Viridibacillus soli]